MKITPLLYTAGLCLLVDSVALAQERDNDKEKERKVYKYDKDKKDKESKYKEKDDKYSDKLYKEKKDLDKEYKYKDKDKEYKYKDKDREYKEKQGRDRDERHEGQGRQPGSKIGDILGRVILPPAGTDGPRRLEGVPRGHYPPPGSCRIWYPTRPPGQQPSHTDCRNLVGVALEPGAFILHGDRAYDASYDWREEERRRPGSVGRDILDILFPRR